MIKAKKSKKVWLSRDEFAGNIEYGLWTTKPRKSVSGGFRSRNGCRIIKYFCPQDLESITGFSLPPGECKAVTIEIKLV